MAERLIDFTSPGWAQIHAWASDELTKLRGLLESETASHDATQVIRGQIKFAKKLLDLPEKANRAREVGSADQHPSGSY